MQIIRGFTVGHFMLSVPVGVGFGFDDALLRRSWQYTSATAGV